MAPFATIDYEKRSDGIAVMTLNRPDVLNAFNVQMRDDMFEVLTAIRDDNQVRGVLVQGNGDRAFCVGADLSEFGTAPSLATARSVRLERDIWNLWSSIDKPIVASINGYCFGSGIEIASFCDIRIATADSVFAMPEVQLGLMPAAGGTQMLPRLLGASRALELLQSGRRFTAQEGLRYGLLNYVVSPGNLMESATTILRAILDTSDAALVVLKKSIREGLDVPLESALSKDRILAIALMHSQRNHSLGESSHHAQS